MNENSERRNYGRDALGGLAVLVGLFSAVSFFLAMLKPIEDAAGGPTGFYMAVSGFVGPIAGLFASLGLAAIGARLWSKGVDLTVLRHLGGVALTTFTLSILVGTLVPNLAGDFGAGVAGRVADTFHPIVAVVVGIALVLLPAWYLWLRPTERAQERADSKSVDPKVTSSAESSGVTAAEAQALLPTTKPAPKKVEQPAQPSTPQAARPSAPRTSPPQATAPAASAVRPTVSSPYPTDVRLSGGIPEGARPLESPHGKPVPIPGHTAAVQREPLRADANVEQRSADAPVARVVAAPAQRVAEPEPVRGPSPVDTGAARRSADPLPEAADRTLSASSNAPLPAAVGFAAGVADTDPIDDVDEDPLDERDEFADERIVDVGALDEADVAQLDTETRLDPTVQPLAAPRTPPAPSWEQPALFTESTEEPVDAYGTPLTLVEALRGQAPATETEDAETEDAAASAPLDEKPSLREVDLTDVDLMDDADVATVRPLPLPVAETSAASRPVEALQHELASHGDAKEAAAKPSTAGGSSAPIRFGSAEFLAQAERDAQENDEPIATESSAVQSAASPATTARGVATRGLFDDLPPESTSAAEPAKSEHELGEHAPQPRGVAPRDERESAAVAPAPVASVAVETVASRANDAEASSDDGELGDDLPMASDEDAIDGDARFDVALDDEEIGSELAEQDELDTDLFTEASVEDTGAARDEESLEPAARTNTPPQTPARVEEKAQPKPTATQATSTEPAAARSATTEASATEPEEPESAAAMSDVVLQPQPARGPKTRAARTVSEPVFKAGLLFVERNRVAVSMLQREFQMDFKQATEVLDQLQQAGLIGPYLGGQRRDILLTADQWRETVEVE